MKNQNQPGLSPLGSFAFLYLSIVGVWVFSFPREVARSSSYQGIWVILLTGLFSMIFFYLITKLTQRFPRQTFSTYIPEILGSKRNRWVGRLLSIPIFAFFVIYFLFIISTNIRIFTEVLVSAVFENTPLSAVIIMFLLTAIPAAMAEPYLLAKVNLFLLPFTLIPILILFYAAFQKGEWVQLFPIFPIDWSLVFRAVLTVIFAFAGYELVIYIAGHYQNSDKSARSHLFVILAVTFTYLLNYLTCLSVFGLDEIKTLMWPSFEIARETYAPMLLLERLEFALLIVWLVNVFACVSNFFMVLVRMIMEIYRFPAKANKMITWFLIFVIYGLAIYPKNFIDLMRWKSWVTMGHLVIVALLILLLLVAIVRKKKGRIEKIGTEMK
jgi:spore germination protein